MRPKGAAFCSMRTLASTPYFPFTQLHAATASCHNPLQAVLDLGITCLYTLRRSQPWTSWAAMDRTQAHPQMTSPLPQPHAPLQHRQQLPQQHPQQHLQSGSLPLLGAQGACCLACQHQRRLQQLHSFLPASLMSHQEQYQQQHQPQHAHLHPMVHRCFQPQQQPAAHTNTLLKRPMRRHQQWGLRALLATRL